MGSRLARSSDLAGFFLAGEIEDKDAAMGRYPWYSITQSESSNLIVRSPFLILLLVLFLLSSVPSISIHSFSPFSTAFLLFRFRNFADARFRVPLRGSGDGENLSSINPSAEHGSEAAEYQLRGDASVECDADRCPGTFFGQSSMSVNVCVGRLSDRQQTKPSLFLSESTPPQCLVLTTACVEISPHLLPLSLFFRRGMVVPVMVVSRTRADKRVAAREKRAAWPPTRLRGRNRRVLAIRYPGHRRKANPAQIPDIHPMGEEVGERCLRVSISISSQAQNPQSPRSPLPSLLSPPSCTFSNLSSPHLSFTSTFNFGHLIQDNRPVQ